MTNTLILTSCNRIKQVLLGLSLTSQIVKNPFNVVICDNSTPDLSSEDALQYHNATDAHSAVTHQNYCNDISLYRDAHKYFPNVQNFRVIHSSPVRPKHEGDTLLLGLGFMQASLLGFEDNYALKVTGVSILKKDILSQLPSILGDKQVVTWGRTAMPEILSTRLIGGRPETFTRIMSQGVHGHLVDGQDIYFCEEKMRYLLGKYLEPHQIHSTNEVETEYLVDQGVPGGDALMRQRIERVIVEENIDTEATPWLKEFLQGGIW